MDKCINTKHPEFIELAKQANMNPLVLKSKIGVWQEKNNSDDFPALEELGIGQEAPIADIKEGVSELFESNPKLANAVYEALGFKTKPDIILPIGTSGSGKSTFIKSLPQENLVVIEPDAMRVEFTGDMNNKSKDKEIYEEAANRAIQAIKQGKQVVFDTTNLTKDKRLPFIEAIKKAIPTANIQYKLMELNPELAKQRIKAQLARGENRAAVSDETIDRHAASYKQMLEDIKNEPISNFEITPQQKQEAQQLYSEYLDTIFPDSKVKDIVYHGTLPENKFEKFDKQRGTNLSGEYGGIHFGDLTAAKERPTKVVQTENFLLGVEEDLANFKPNIIPVILNISNIKRVEEGKNWGQGDWNKLISKEQEADAFIYSNKIENKGKDSYVVFEPEQIHILGSKQDIEGFKEFIKGSNNSSQQSQQSLAPKTLEELGRASLQEAYGTHTDESLISTAFSEEYLVDLEIFSSYFNDTFPFQDYIKANPIEVQLSKKRELSDNGRSYNAYYSLDKKRVFVGRGATEKDLFSAILEYYLLENEDIDVQDILFDMVDKINSRDNNFKVSSTDDIIHNLFINEKMKDFLKTQESTMEEYKNLFDEFISVIAEKGNLKKQEVLDILERYSRIEVAEAKSIDEISKDYPDVFSMQVLNNIEEC